MTPTARSLAYLRRLGFIADVCERWIPGACIRRDLFGLFDIVAVDSTDRIFMIQATTRNHIAHRLKKMEASPMLAQILRAGVLVEVWGWGQARAGKKWTVKRTPLILVGQKVVEARPLPTSSLCLEIP